MNAHKTAKMLLMGNTLVSEVQEAIEDLLDSLGNGTEYIDTDEVTQAIKDLLRATTKYQSSVNLVMAELDGELTLPGSVTTIHTLIEGATDA